MGPGVDLGREQLLSGWNDSQPNLGYCCTRITSPGEGHWLFLAESKGRSNCTGAYSFFSLIGSSWLEDDALHKEFHGPASHTSAANGLRKALAFHMRSSESSLHVHAAPTRKLPPLATSPLRVHYHQWRGCAAAAQREAVPSKIDKCIRFSERRCVKYSVSSLQRISPIFPCSSGDFA